jgi:hypothetical protein
MACAAIGFGHQDCIEQDRYDEAFGVVELGEAASFDSALRLAASGSDKASVRPIRQVAMFPLPKNRNPNGRTFAGKFRRPRDRNISSQRFCRLF